MSLSLGTLLLEIAEAAYLKCLAPGDIAKHFGSANSSTWIEGWTAYRRQMTIKVMGVARDLLSPEELERCEEIMLDAGMQKIPDDPEAVTYTDTLSASDKEILVHLPFHVRKALRSSQNTWPHQPLSTPFLCPSFLFFLVKKLQELAPIWALIAHWFAPGAADSPNASVHRIEIPGMTTRLFKAFSYFCHHGEKEWATTTEEVLMQAKVLPEEEGTYGEAVEQLFISTFFNRYGQVIQHMANIKAVSTFKLPACYDAGAAKRPDLVVLREDTLVRYHQEIPRELASCEPSLLEILQTMERSALNFAVSYKNTNRTAFTNRMATLYLTDSQRMAEKIVPLMTEAEVMAFFRAFYDLVRGTPGLKSFRPAFEPAEKGEVMEWEGDDEAFSANHKEYLLKMQKEELRGLVHGLLHKMAKNPLSGVHGKHKDDAGNEHDVNALKALLEGPVVNLLDAIEQLSPAENLKDRDDIDSIAFHPLKAYPAIFIEGPESRKRKNPVKSHAGPSKKSRAVNFKVEESDEEIE
ncbi:hypothetical protein C8F01DRAFT_1303239 [Mycena amicta]|nr:hypothetical protein C8F01DRAFT_1303239 [Mycena amicta]